MDRLIPEHASIRQRVKRGFILVWASKHYTTEWPYGAVTSWYIFQTKKQACAIISLVVMLAYLDLISQESTSEHVK